MVTGIVGIKGFKIKSGLVGTIKGVGAGVGLGVGVVVGVGVAGLAGKKDK
jgi:hypothetical protein